METSSLVAVFLLAEPLVFSRFAAGTAKAVFPTLYYVCGFAGGLALFLVGLKLHNET